MNKLKNRNPFVFVILDGWGAGIKDKSLNAIEAAKTPFFDHVKKSGLYTQLGAFGRDVGLEGNQISGSEAGHLNIGAGRVVKQDVRTILESIDNGSFFYNPVLLHSLSHIKKYGSNLHLVGLMGNNDSPHAHPDIVLALLIFFKKHNLGDRVFLHLFSDGRDSYPRSAQQRWREWKAMLNSVGAGRVVTVGGRFYGMDRTKNWDRLVKAYEVMTQGKGEKFDSVEEMIESNYQRGSTDEFFEPSIIADKEKSPVFIKDNDSVIFFNFRSDRARQFSKLFVGTNTKKERGFPSYERLSNLSFVAMTNFGPDLNLKTAFPSSPLTSTLPLALNELRQLYISETEKFAHITYFLNGGYDNSIGGEERIMVASPRVRSYAERPEMSAKEITDVVIGNLKHGIYDFLAINFANADMVGHTGDFKATVKATEVIDDQLKRIYGEVKKRNGSMVITADHGNAELMIDKETGRANTFHTRNPVPFIYISSNKQRQGLRIAEGGVLGGIAPTILHLLDIHIPDEMSKESLIV